MEHTFPPVWFWAASDITARLELVGIMRAMLSISWADIKLVSSFRKNCKNKDRIDIGIERQTLNLIEILPVNTKTTNLWFWPEIEHFSHVVIEMLRFHRIILQPIISLQVHVFN